MEKNKVVICIYKTDMFGNEIYANPFYEFSIDDDIQGSFKMLNELVEFLRYRIKKIVDENPNSVILIRTLSANDPFIVLKLSDEGYVEKRILHPLSNREVNSVSLQLY